ncbi:MAG: hypothetical protein KA734_12565 [Fluviicola sp.]|nr:hypothetical protein [Fluviicola sp.]MBP6271924.1 hypothetical protein [Fluviicola sp.]
MDDEVKNGANSYTTFFRQLDPRLGRWMSLDPVFQPHQSPYNSMDNNPIMLNDILGDSTKFKIIGTDKIEVIDDGIDVEIDQVDFNNVKKSFENAPILQDEDSETCEKKDLGEYFEYLSRLGLGTNGYKLALADRSKIGSKEWAFNLANPPFNKDQNKCNQFVWDMVKQISPNSISGYTAGSPPRAGEGWANKNVNLTGLTLVDLNKENIMLGDIVGGKTNYARASGHVEIVTGIDPLTGIIISTGAGSKIVRNSNFIDNVINGDMWATHVYSPFAVRRLK